MVPDEVGSVVAGPVLGLSVGPAPVDPASEADGPKSCEAIASSGPVAVAPPVAIEPSRIAS